MNPRPRKNIVLAVLAVTIMVLGVWLRLSPKFAGVIGAGHDERLYSGFVDQLAAGESYPEFVQSYLTTESGIPEKRVSPLRSLYLLTASWWSQVSPGNGFEILKKVSFGASVLSFLVAGLFARRLGGDAAGLAVLAMMATAPLQIFNAHRALLDGFFCLWSLLTLWSLWGCLEQPERKIFPLLHGLSWIPMVMTKETSFFVYLSVLLILVVIPDSSGKRTNWRNWAAVFVGPAAGFTVLMLLCGGPKPFWSLLEMALHKQLSPYTMFHADGPWYGYLLALTILSPMVTVVSLAGMFGPGLFSRSGRFMIIAVLGVIVPLAFFPYQIVPRLFTVCDFPLRWLCWLQICWLSRKLPAKSRVVLRALAVLLLCWLGFRQFLLFFQVHGVYEPTSDIMLQCIEVVKWTR